MRNISSLFWILFLVEGVPGSGEETVKLWLFVGDNATLNAGLTEVPSSDTVRWLYEGVRLAEISGGKVQNKELHSSLKKFEDKLQLDEKTGSLNITNMNTEHSGEYKMTIRSKKWTFNITVNGDVVSRSVLTGDSVILFTGVTKMESYQMQLKFNQQVIYPSSLNGAVDPSWSNIDLNNERGHIVISSIRTNQFGDYEVEIKNNDGIMIFHKKYRINSSGDVVTKSVLTGNDFNLFTGVTEMKSYQMELKFNDQVIYTSNGAVDSSWSNIDLNEESGNLIISSIRTNQSGDYEVKIKNNVGSMILHKKYRINSIEPPSGAVSRICGAGVVLALGVVTAFLLQEV